MSSVLKTAILLPMSLCGMAAFLASSGPHFATETRWELRILGFVLMLPSVIVMVLTIPFWPPDLDPDEDAN